MRWSQLTFTIICVHVSVCVRHWILLTHQEWRSALFSSPSLFQAVPLGFTGAKNTTCHNGVCQVEEVVKVLEVGSVNIPGIFSACSPKLNSAGVEFGRSTLEIISCMMWSSVRYWWRDKEISTFNYLLTHFKKKKDQLVENAYANMGKDSSFCFGFCGRYGKVHWNVLLGVYISF